MSERERDRARETDRQRERESEREREKDRERGNGVGLDRVSVGDVGPVALFALSERNAAGVTARCAAAIRRLSSAARVGRGQLRRRPSRQCPRIGLPDPPRPSSESPTCALPRRPPAQVACRLCLAIRPATRSASVRPGTSAGIRVGLYREATGAEDTEAASSAEGWPDPGPAHRT